MEVLQVPSELESMMRLHAEKKPTRLLEIGCWDGGTLREWLTNAPAKATVVAVDLEHRNRDAYAEWTKPDTSLVLGTGNSQADDMVQLIRDLAPYDWVFVDGDHEYWAAKHDVDVTLPLINPGGVLALHDITPPDGMGTYPPGVILEELGTNGYRTERYQDLSPAPWARGIGICHIPEADE